jgi:hypothetical protein
MSARIGLFEVELPALGRLEGWRNFSGPFPYQLSATNYPDHWWDMAVEDAIILGRVANIIRNRFREARERDTPIKTGSVWSLSTDDGVLIIDIQVYDDNSIALQFFALPLVRLPGHECNLLLAAFDRFGEDVRLIGAGNSRGLASAGPTNQDYRWKGE